MYFRTLPFIVLIFIFGFSTQAKAGLVADSVGEFSSSQGQDSWFYGFYNQGPTGGLPHGYTISGFEEFETFAGTRWEATGSQVGSNNNVFLSVDALGGHPNGLDLGQDSLIWAVRRYQSEVNGLVDIAFDLRKLNVVNLRGGGITGRIFVDGIEVLTQFIANADHHGVQGTLTQNVSVGDYIDFVIDPTSIDPPAGQPPFSARADGSHFSATISTSVIPEPSTMALLSIGCLVLVGQAVARNRHHQCTPPTT